ncbi:VOC family protein [Streptomyces sp. NPDC001640]
MINGAHMVIYSRDAEADRLFFRDVLGWAHVDAGHGWLVFKAPPAEVAFHPAEGEPEHQLMLMCDDLDTTMSELASKGVEFTRGVSEARWGRVTGVRLPGGSDIGLYGPLHPVAHGL